MLHRLVAAIRSKTAGRPDLPQQFQPRRALSISRFCYHQTMSIEITGPKRPQPWRGAMHALVIAGILGAIGLILLGLLGEFLVDWLWFSSVGYSPVFWTSIGAEAAVFAVVSRRPPSSCGVGSNSICSHPA